MSAQITRQRIKEAALRCMRMQKRLRLSPAYISSRERWSIQRIHWRQRQWQRVIFTNESRFRLFRADGRIKVWQVPWQELLLQHLQISERQLKCQHVWVEITLNSHIRAYTSSSQREMSMPTLRRGYTATSSDAFHRKDIQLS